MRRDTPDKHAAKEEGLMAHTTIDELERSRLAVMSADDRADFHETSAVARAALRVCEMVRDARRAAGLSQQELAKGMNRSQATVTRLEAGSVGTRLTTLHRAARALGLKLEVEFSAPDRPVRPRSEPPLLPATGRPT